MRGENRDPKIEAREPRLPPGYRFDQNDPAFVFLLRQDDSRVAVFNGWSASPEHIERAAEEDLRGHSSP